MEFDIVEEQGVFEVWKSGIFIGFYRTYEEAQDVVDMLKVDWGKPKTERKEKKRKEPKYYSRRPNGRYIVSKSIDGKQIQFVTVRTEEQAKTVVEKLKECD